MELIQLKLTSGEEVVAEVLEYPDGEMPEYVVRHAFRINSMVNYDEEMSVTYGLAPYMMLQETSTDFILIDPSNIVSIAKPSQFMMREYNHALSYTGKIHGERLKRKEEFDAVFLEKLEEYTKNLTDKDLLDSSSSSNVIAFPDKDTLH